MSFDCTGAGRAGKAMSTTASRACMVRREHFSMTVGLLCGLCRGGAGRAETAGAAHGLRQLGDGQPVDAAEGRDAELREALAPMYGEQLMAMRSEERRVGEESVRPCKFRGWRYSQKKKTK